MRNVHKIGENIYITSGEEIKDCYVITDLDKIIKVDKSNEDFYHLFNCKKIILTTDQDLIKDGVQAIDDEFLEWFVKNPSCEEVEIESHIYKGQDETEYKIIIPKEKLKCHGIISSCLKLVCDCESKQETLEEAAEKYYNNYDKRKVEFAFIDGAKWQQERNYSEEEIINILYKHTEYLFGENKHLLLEDWFEQFKKK